MSVSQAKGGLSPQMVVLLAQQAFHNATTPDEDGDVVKDEGALVELIAFEFEQLLYQALGLKVGADTPTGYYLLPQVPPSEWRQ